MKQASEIKAGDVIELDNLGWRKVLEVDCNYAKNGGWVYFIIEGHPEESRKAQKCSIYHDVKLPWRRS